MLDGAECVPAVGHLDARAGSATRHTFRPRGRLLFNDDFETTRA